MRYRLPVIAAAWIASLVTPGSRAFADLEDLVISEFLASNRSIVRDEDGDSSDFVEIYNAGADAVDIGGCYLTDDGLDLTKWRFPSVEVPPSGFLLVFCSDKDRRDPSSELHANFRLETAPAFLGLIAPDGETALFSFAPYPEQVTDFSYGLAQNATVVPLVAADVDARAFVPPNGNLGTSWLLPGFDDSGWLDGSLGVGYERGSGYEPYIDLDVRDEMEDVSMTCYIRVPFTLPDATGLSGLVLRMRYDDGFIAYLNGERIASGNAPAVASWNSGATNLHDDGDAVQFEEFVVAGGGAFLRDGLNVLAIHGLNDNLGSSDFLCQAELEGLDSGDLDRDTVLYFPQPTPGSANLPGAPGITMPPTVVPTSRVFTGNLRIQMAAPSGTGTVRYTTDGSVPTSSSTEYTGPFNLSASTQIRARVFEPDGAVSPLTSRSYIRLAADVESFESQLPIVIVDNFGAGSVPGNGFQPCFIAIYEPSGGATQLSGAAALQSRGGIRTRGSSTAGRPKKAYRFEFWDESNEDKDLSPLGLPSESDWILYGAYNFDRAHIRNAFIYELSNQVGRYATRTEFCEVFVNTGGGSLAQSDYVGLYTFMESIKRGPDRVDVERLTPSHDSEPEIAGGYMWKIDRADPGDSGFRAANQTIRWVYPKEEEVTGPQAQWSTDHFNTFYSALQGANYRDPDVGYRRYIDPESWVDHSILNVLPKNVDALRLSAYFYKSRQGKIEFGPIWDFDRSMDSTDGRDNDPRTWYGTGDATRFFDYPWWERLFDDVDFWQLWRDRWHEHRQGPVSDSNMRSIIDFMAFEIEGSIARDNARWGQASLSSWRNHINSMKNWLTTRAEWIDGQFAPVPRFNRPPGQISPGFNLTMTSSEGSIYYTLDGRDPRAPGGGIAPDAVRYTGAVSLNGNARAVARTRVSSSDWSAPNGATYYTELPRLVITELHYHPADPPEGSPHSDDDFEFIELQNVGPTPIALEGFSLTAAVEFTFPAMTLLSGDYVVVVENEEAFATRYDTASMLIAGQYAGRLDNDGEILALRGPLDEPILGFAFEDTWYPSTDGLGDSLTIRDPNGPQRMWDEMEGWAAGSFPHGTPGAGDDGFPPLGGRQLPGDGNQDGRIDVSDAFSLVRRLFVGELPPLCDDDLSEGGARVLLDVNGDEGVDISDVSYLLGYLFQAGPAPTLGTDCVRIEGCPNNCGF